MLPQVPDGSFSVCDGTSSPSLSRSQADICWRFCILIDTCSPSISSPISFSLYYCSLSGGHSCPVVRLPIPHSFNNCNAPCHFRGGDLVEQSLIPIRSDLPSSGIGHKQGWYHVYMILYACKKSRITLNQPWKLHALPIWAMPWAMSCRARISFPGLAQKIWQRFGTQQTQTLEHGHGHFLSDGDSCHGRAMAPRDGHGPWVTCFWSNWWMFNSRLMSIVWLPDFHRFPNCPKSSKLYQGPNAFLRPLGKKSMAACLVLGQWVRPSKDIPAPVLVLGGCLERQKLFPHCVLGQVTPRIETGGSRWSDLPVKLRKTMPHCLMSAQPKNTSQNPPAKDPAWAVGSFCSSKWRGKVQALVPGHPIPEHPKRARRLYLSCKQRMALFGGWSRWYATMRLDLLHCLFHDGAVMPHQVTSHAGSTWTNPKTSENIKTVTDVCCVMRGCKKTWQSVLLQYVHQV